MDRIGSVFRVIDIGREEEDVMAQVTDAYFS